MIAKPTSPQSIGQVLDRSFRLAAASFRHTWLLALISGIASYAATIYQFASGGAQFSALLVPQDPVYWILYAAGLLVSVWFAAAIYYRIDAVASGTLEDTPAVSMALRRLPLMIVLVILWVLAICVGLLLLIIPGIILIISLMPAQMVYLLEDKGPVAALAASHRLVWGHWWRTFAILLVGGIIALVVYILMYFVAGVIAAVAGSAEAALAAMLSVLIGIALAGIFLAPYLVSLLLNIYWDLKLRKEGGDLAARAQAV